MTPPQNLKQLINIFLGIINPLLLLLAGLSLLVFLWGLTSFIFKSGDEKALVEGKALMKWGLIALFVMLSLMGIITLLGTTFGLQISGIPLLPPNR